MAGLRTVPDPGNINPAAQRRTKPVKVNAGVRCVVWSIATALPAGFIMVVPSLRPSVLQAPVLYTLAMIARLVLQCAGYGFCLSVPEETKARPFIVALVIIVAASLLVAMFVLPVSLASGSPQALPWFGPAQFLQALCGLAGMAVPILFLMFLRRISPVH